MKWKTQKDFNFETNYKVDANNIPKHEFYDLNMLRSNVHR